MRHFFALLLALNFPFTVSAADYNLVIVNEDGSKIATYGLSPSRIRNGGALSARLYTLNLKKDDLLKKIGNTDVIKYHIEKGDESASYRPWGNNDYEMGSGTASHNIISGEYLNTTGSTSQANNFTLTLSKGVSYTWYFDTIEEGEYHHPLTIHINVGALADTTPDYYLIGNFSDANATVNIQPWKEESRVKLKKIYFKDGNVTSTAEGCDSVVCRATVPRPVNGWGELYMIVASANIVENSTEQFWNTADGGWSQVIRPQVQWYDENGNSSYGMDATALRGGLFQTYYNGPDDHNNQSQALNPLLSGVYSNATSYTFSMNITTSTYGVTFNEDNMFIMGPAIGGQLEEGKTGWENDDTGASSANAYKLTWNSNEQCYQYIVGGEETPIVFTPGSAFRFVQNKDLTNIQFGEDDNIPADLTSSNNAYTANGQNFDTQYVNYLTQHSSNTSEHHNADNGDIIFNLPRKSNDEGHIIRFYIKKIGDETKYFYTVNRRITFTEPTNIDINQLGYTYYRSFSEWHACKKPSNVDVFVVSESNMATKQATVTQLQTDYIPARTGVILATNSAAKIDFETYAINPEIEYDGNNLLVAQMDNVVIPETVNGKHNYIFYNKRNADNGNRNELGFYRPERGFMSGRNFSYLQTGDNASGAKGLSIVFEDGATGISEARTRNIHNENSNVHNLQGMKIPKGNTKKGIYIINGQQVIIK